MVSDAFLAQIANANLEDLEKVLSFAGQRALNLLRNGEIDQVKTDEMSLMPVGVVQQLIKEQLLVPTSVAVKEIKGLSSTEAISAAVGSKRTPLGAVRVGRSWYFTVAWMRDYERRRYIGRTPVG